MATFGGTAAYEFSHGKRPRGRGLWAFDLIRLQRGSTPEEIAQTWWSKSNELYSVAKAAAMARARELNCDLVNLLT